MNNSRSSRDARRRRATELLNKRSSRSDQEQLRRLDMLLGKDQGAQRERARLKARIDMRFIDSHLHKKAK